MRNINTLRKIISLLRLTPDKKKIRLYLLGLLVAFTSAVEVFSVYLIIPTYKSLIEKIPLSETIPIFTNIFKLSFSSIIQEQLFILFIFTFIFIITNFLKALIIWESGMRTADICVFLFSTAYSKVLFKPYEELSNSNISRYSSNFNTTNTYFFEVFKNTILLIGYLTTTIILSLSLIFINPKVTICAFIFLIIPYIILSKFTGPILRRISTQQALLHEEINRYIQEGFKALKTIKHFNVENFYAKTFLKKELRLRRISAVAEFINTFPKLVLEASGVSLITILFVISFFIKTIDVPIIFILTLAFAAQKILPTLQQIFRIWAYILGHSSSVDDLYNYFFHEQVSYKKNFRFKKNKIIFNNISYQYPKNEKYTLSNLNLNIDFPNSIFISGDSGCGKTTLVDLLTGLLIPTKGYITLPAELKDLKSVGYVPQEVPLINGTILDNIYLDNKKSKRDDVCLKKFIEIVELQNLIKELPAGLNTILGEQSINLSGGQKQRLGILRALVRKPKILILDESTNALDKNCEQSIIKKLLFEFKESLIIMISHNQNINKSFKVNLFLNKKGELIKEKYNYQT